MVTCSSTCLCEIELTNLFEDLVYGAIGNPGSRWMDLRIAQSVTLTGRSIVKHMCSKINEIITGVYDHLGVASIYADTDSVEKSTIIKTSSGDRTVEDLFLSGDLFWKNGEKEYSVNKNIKLLEFNENNKKIDWNNYNYVYRHKVSKKKFKINTENGKSVVVTEDHSVMIMTDDGNLISKKPNEITVGDKIVSI